MQDGARPPRFKSVEAGLIILSPVASMAAVEVLFPQIYGGSMWIIGLALLMLGFYLWLAAMAAREQPA